MRKLLLLLVFFGVAGGCSRQPGPGVDAGDEANLYLRIQPLASSINADQVLWEDRVDELRMLAFRTDDGEVAFNQLLYFPNGFDQRSRAVRMLPGTYDFYFIANETVYPDDFAEALEEISNVSEFTTDTRFLMIDYNPAFVPDGTTSDGRMLMSAVYNAIAIESGGTEANPLPIPIPTATVELIRSLAKVEVIFRKRTAGSDVPDNTITSVTLGNVASGFSVPPSDQYYTGAVESSLPASTTDFDYANDSIGAVTFYIPEFLVAEGGTRSTELQINNQAFPIQTDDNKIGLLYQRRTVPGLSNNSVIRNYHYVVNVYLTVEGGPQIEVHVVPWTKDTYIYLFEGDKQIVVPPVYPTDSSIIIPTECGKVEIMSHNEALTQGLQGAYNDQIIYYDPSGNYPRIDRGDPPYYCEKKYGPGWRLINSCELMSFLAYCDQAYNIWTSNTWEARDNNIPYHPIAFRQAAQLLLEKLTGEDLSATVFYNENNWEDEISDWKLDLIDRFFTPGDIMLKLEDFPGGWPYSAPPNTSETWYYIEATIQVKAYWYQSGYVSPSVRANWDEILYGEFQRYDFGSTVSRCVRTVN